MSREERTICMSLPLPLRVKRKAKYCPVPKPQVLATLFIRLLVDVSSNEDFSVNGSFAW